MTPKQIADEIQKCKDSPYYFCTTYMKIKTGRGEMIPFTTLLTEKEFNEQTKRFYHENKPL